MRRNLIETVMGAVVLLVAALFVWFAYTTAQCARRAGYTVTATFGKAGGIAVGNDVRISGIKVGSVTARELDTHELRGGGDHEHRRRRQAARGYRRQSIASEGPLGGRYVRLEPGGASATIPPGGHIRETRGFRSLEDQVGEIIFLATGKRDEPKP